jgi:hypothetical protein
MGEQDPAGAGIGGFQYACEGAGVEDRGLRRTNRQTRDAAGIAGGDSMRAGFGPCGPFGGTLERPLLPATVPHGRAAGGYRERICTEHIGRACGEVSERRPRCAAVNC